MTLETLLATVKLALPQLFVGIRRTLALRKPFGHCRIERDVVINIKAQFLATMAALHDRFDASQMLRNGLGGCGTRFEKIQFVGHADASTQHDLLPNPGWRLFEAPIAMKSKKIDGIVIQQAVPYRLEPWTVVELLVGPMKRGPRKNDGGVQVCFVSLPFSSRRCLCLHQEEPGSAKR